MNPRDAMSDITAIELRARRIALCMSRDDLAKLLGVAFDTVRSWEGGRHPIPPAIRAEIAAIEEQMLASVDAIVESGKAAMPVRNAPFHNHALAVIGLAFQDREDIEIVEDGDVDWLAGLRSLAGE